MRRQGTILFEIVIAVFLFAIMMVPLVSALSSNNRVGHNNVHTLTSLYLCEELLANVVAQARIDFDALSSESDMLTFAPGGEAPVSRYAGTQPGGGLERYRASVDVAPFEGRGDARLVKATVYHRLAARDPWRAFSLSTVVTRGRSF